MKSSYQESSTVLQRGGSREKNGRRTAYRQEGEGILHVLAKPVDSNIIQDKTSYDTILNKLFLLILLVTRIWNHELDVMLG